MIQPKCEVLDTTFDLFGCLGADDEACDFPVVPWVFFGQKNCREGDPRLGGGFKDFLFSPLPGEMIQFDEHIFQKDGSTITN